jgi:MATE family multidrug resistance protein
MRTQAPSRDAIGLADVARLAWPITLSMLASTFMGLVDTLFVGRLGTAHLAAVGLAVTVVFLAQAFGMGLVTGLKIVVSHRTGAQDEDAVASLFWQALWISLAVGLATAATVPLWRPMLFVLGGDPEVGTLSYDYFSSRTLGAPLFLMFLGLSGWFHGRGDTRTPMVASMLCNVTNLMLDPLLIFGAGPIPALGVAGAGWATVLGFVPSVLWLLWFGHRVSPVITRPDRTLLSDIWRLGLPTSLRNVLNIGSYVLLSALLAQVGAVDLAAHIIAIRIVSVSFMPGYALGEAAAVWVGQSLGAGAPHRARQAWWAGCQLSVAVMSGWAVVFWTVPTLLVGVFGADPEVTAVAVTLLGVAAMFQTLDAVAMTTMSALNGAGDTRFVMITSVSSMWLVKLPVAWVFAVGLGMGAWGAWIGLTLETLAIAAVVVWRVRGDAWLTSAQPATA